MINNDYLSFDQASAYLGISKKYLENYVKIGDEIKQYKVGRRKLLSKSEVEIWKRQRDFNTIKLDRDDYLKCLEFSIKSYYKYSSKSNFGTSQQRDAGKFISNFVIGKLGEISVSKFFKKHFNILIKLDFELRDAVVGQDITEIAFPRKNVRVYNPLKKRISIKTSKMKNIWLIVNKKEVEDDIRSSDVYIFSRVGLYLDHLIRIFKDSKVFSGLSEIIPPFKPIEAEVCGFVFRKELTMNPPVCQLPKPKQDIQLSYIYKTGKLHKDIESWKKLLEQL